MTNLDFKWKHFVPEIILWCLRWYGSTPISYADFSDMLAERGILVNRFTIYRWLIEYSPKLRRNLGEYSGWFAWYRRVMLFYAFLCFSMLFYAFLCFSMLFYAFLCFSMVLI